MADKWSKIPSFLLKVKIGMYMYKTAEKAIYRNTCILNNNAAKR